MLQLGSTNEKELPVMNQHSKPWQGANWNGMNVACYRSMFQNVAS
jgi:hypothetical protein